MLHSREQFVATMTDLLDADDSAALVIADISGDRFLPAARRHPDRVLNVGIREQAMIGVTAGLSLAGFRPVAHSYATFLVERPFEQIKLDLGHQDVGAVLVSVGASYDASGEGRTHQSPGDVALLDTLPGWTVQLPGHPSEVDTLLRSAMQSSGRVYLRLSDLENRRAIGAIGGARTDGRMTVVRTGTRATIVAVGHLLDPVLEAVTGLDVTVCYASTIRPFDTETLLGSLASAGATGATGATGASDVAIVEPLLAGTSAGVVSKALSNVPHRLLCLGIEDVELRKYGSPAEHAVAYGLDPAGIRRSLVGWLGLVA
jgi:transketolase